MPAITPFAKLAAVLLVAILDIVNYIWGIDFLGLRNEQVLGVIVTIILAALGMVVPAAPRVAQTLSADIPTSIDTLDPPYRWRETAVLWGLYCAFLTWLKLRRLACRNP